MSSHRNMKARCLEATPAILVLVVIVLLWYWVSYFGLTESQRFLLPPLQDVVKVGMLDWKHFGEILLGLWATTKVALTGLAVAVIMGIFFAVLMVQTKALERAIFPYAVFLQTIPILAIVPVIGFWFGFNFQSRVIVCVLFSLFPIITNTLYGLQSVTPAQSDLFRLRGASRPVVLWKLQFPAALPSIFTGLRISAGLSVIGAIVGDFFFRQGEVGIGRLIDLYAQRLATEQLITAVMMSSLLGFVVFWLFGLVGDRATRSRNIRS